MLKGKLSHAPYEPSSSEDQARAEILRRQKRVQLDFVTAMSHFGCFAEFDPTEARPGEELPTKMYKSNPRFLINKQVMEIKLDKKKVLKEMEFFQKYVVIAYFEGGGISSISLQKWLGGLKGEINNKWKLERDICNGFFSNHHESRRHCSENLDDISPPFKVGN